MPSLYYTFTQTIPFSTQTVQFVMVDTSSLTGGDAGQPDSAPPSSAQPPVDETQWTWVEDTLTASKADWIIVVGHFPVYSVGENGPTAMLVERLLPLMEAAGVALYICGHDHQMEHIAPVQTPTPGAVDFVVTGAGAKYNQTEDHLADIPAGTLKFQYGAGCGFTSVGVTRRGWEASTMTVTFWDAGANALYSFSKANPRLKDMPPAPPRPPHPPSIFASPSNKAAVVVGSLGIVAGCLVIASGLAIAVKPPTSEGAPLLARAPPGRPGGAGGAAGSAVSLERGEKAGLLLQQRGLGYGGVSSAATRVTNRL
jgi:hypothetical protein